MLKVAITGPKNSGKSIITEYVSEKLDEAFADDFSEQFLKQREREFNFEDLEEIGRGQKMLMEFLNPKKYLITETEMLYLKIWSEIKFGKCSSYIIQEWHKQEFDLYLVCWPKAKYQEDYNAEDFANKIIEELDIREANYLVLKGNNAQRKLDAFEAIKKISRLS